MWRVINVGTWEGIAVSIVSVRTGRLGIAILQGKPGAGVDAAVPQLIIIGA